MRRRDLLTSTLGFSCFAVIDRSEAQPIRRKRLGYLSGGKRGTGSKYTIEILKASLSDLVV